MQCPTCCGLGRLTYDELPPEAKAAAGLGSTLGATFPCPDCGGSGTTDHCGDGSCGHHHDEHAEQDRDV
jgi:hypothetical protein